MINDFSVCRPLGPYFAIFNVFDKFENVFKLLFAARLEHQILLLEIFMFKAIFKVF